MWEGENIIIPRWEVGDVFIKKKKIEIGDAFTAVSHMKVGDASAAISHDRNRVFSIKSKNIMT